MPASRRAKQVLNFIAMRPKTWSTERKARTSWDAFTTSQRVRKEMHTSFIKDGLQLGHVPNGDAGVTVSAPVFGSSGQRVWIWELHQVNHLGTHPQPSTPIGKLVIRTCFVYLKTWLTRKNLTNHLLAHASFEKKLSSTRMLAGEVGLTEKVLIIIEWPFEIFA